MTKSYITITLVLVFFWLIGCESPQHPLTSVPALNPNTQIVRSLTDQTLLALSTHNYRRLRGLLAPSQQSLSGSQIAALLLGNDHAEIILEYWDMQRVAVTFDAASLRATAEISIRYRRRANRKPTTTQTTLHFRKEEASQVWTLDLQHSE